jgi:hypothetical protein
LGKAAGLFGKKKGTETVPFSAAGEGHRVWLDATGPQPRLMVASETKALEALLNSLDTRTPELGDPTKEGTAKDLIAQARPLGATAMSQVKDDKDGTAGAEVAKPQLEQLATILAQLFNMFGTYPGGRQIDWDPAQVKEVLGNLTASVSAARQAKDSRDMVMAAYGALTAEQKQYVTLGEFGVAVGVYLDASNTPRVVAGINDIGIGGRQDAEQAREAYGKAIEALKAQLSARGITEITGGNLTTSSRKKAMHEEIIIRNYLRDKGMLAATVIPIGVSQDTVCGRCVHDLATGGTLSVKGGVPSNVSSGPVGEGKVADPAAMQSVLVAGQNLYHILH